MVRSGTAGDGGGKIPIDGNFEPGRIHRPPQPPRQVKTVQRQNPALLGVEPIDPVTKPRLRHGEQPLAIGLDDQFRRYPYVPARHSPTIADRQRARCRINRGKIEIGPSVRIFSMRAGDSEKTQRPDIGEIGERQGGAMRQNEHCLATGFVGMKGCARGTTAAGYPGTPRKHRLRPYTQGCTAGNGRRRLR